jgi:hypothetical protein
MMMPIKLKAFMKRLLIVSTVSFAALTAPLQAKAETIFLTCDGRIITVDLTNRTVNDEYRASITPVGIDWHQANEAGDARYYIDRTAGTLMTSGVYHTPNGDTGIPVSIVKCAASKTPPRTKF